MRAVCSSSRARLSLSRRSAVRHCAFFPPTSRSGESGRHRFQPGSRVISYGAVDLFKLEELQILPDRLRRLAAAECMDNGIQRDSRVSNVVVEVNPWSETP